MIFDFLILPYWHLVHLLCQPLNVFYVFYFYFSFVLFLTFCCSLYCSLHFAIKFSLLMSLWKTFRCFFKVRIERLFVIFCFFLLFYRSFSIELIDWNTFWILSNQITKTKITLTRFSSNLIHQFSVYFVYMYWTAKMCSISIHI